MSQIIEKDRGVKNAAQRYEFTNITDEEFVCYWNKLPITVGAHKTVSVPEYLANKMTNELVDKIMLTAVKLNETNFYKANPNTMPNFYRAPNSLGVPAARKVWEDQIVRKLQMDEGSTEAQLLRLQIKDELENDLKAEASTEPPVIPVSVVGNFGVDSLKEMAQIGENKIVAVKETKKKK